MLYTCKMCSNLASALAAVLSMYLCFQPAVLVASLACVCFSAYKCCAMEVKPAGQRAQPFICHCATQYSVRFKFPLVTIRCSANAIMTALEATYSPALDSSQWTKPTFAICSHTSSTYLQPKHYLSNKNQTDGQQSWTVLKYHFPKKTFCWTCKQDSNKDPTSAISRRT